MGSEDAAARVAEIRAKYAAPQWYSMGVPMGPSSEVRADIACVLAAYDAQAARLAAVEAERDQQTALVRRWDERDHEKTVQLARLAALEATARAWDENHGGDHDCAACQELQRALAAPPGATPICPEGRARIIAAYGRMPDDLRVAFESYEAALTAAEQRATRAETFLATLRDEMHVQSDPYAREYGDRIDDTLRTWARDGNAAPPGEIGNLNDPV